MTEKSLAIFEGYGIRRYYDEKTETWYFSVIDVVGALTDSVNARDYWFKMKIRVKSEGGLELSTVCRQLKKHVKKAAVLPKKSGWIWKSKPERRWLPGYLFGHR